MTPSKHGTRMPKLPAWMREGSPWRTPPQSATFMECAPRLVTSKGRLYFRDSWSGEVQELVGLTEAVKAKQTPRNVAPLIAVANELIGGKPRVFEAGPGKAIPLDSESWRGVREFDPESWSWSVVDIPHFSGVPAHPVVVVPHDDGRVEVFFSKLPLPPEMRVPWRRPIA